MNSDSALKTITAASDLNLELLVSSQSYPDAQPLADTFGYRVHKRALELLFLLLSSPLVVPLVVLICVVVRFTSPGSVFYSHQRLRRNGETFRIWKFRTMRIDADAILQEHLRNNPAARKEWEMAQKLKDDPRVTKVGRVLRRYSLDEFPQLWNVLNGTMRLVGPRPITAGEIHKYGSFFSLYCSVDPGLTGLWQVSGRSELSYRERVMLDCEYVNLWSLSADLKILAQTFRVLVSGRGAY